MARFVSTAEIDAPPEAVFALLTDWPAHARFIPLTTMRVLTARPDGVGARFVGRSGIGPLAFDDVMEVVRWRPPEPGVSGLCTVAKIGRVLTGEATLEVTAVGAGADRSAVSWTEDVRLTPARLTRPLGPVLGLVGKLGFDRTLKLMKRELEHG